MDVSMFRGTHASAVSRSRHSKPPVQLTVQFNRGIGRNPGWRAGADGQTADALARRMDRQRRGTQLPALVANAAVLMHTNRASLIRGVPLTTSHQNQRN